MSKTPTRIYLVSRKGVDHARLIRAATQAQALRHVALDEYMVDVATQDQLVDCVSEGVHVEDAAATDAA